MQPSQHIILAGTIYSDYNVGLTLGNYYRQQALLVGYSEFGITTPQLHI